MAGFEILDPTVEPRKQALTYVPRPDSLKGKRIGLVENTKFNSDKLLATGFRPKKKVDDAIREIVHEYRRGELKDEDRFHNLKWMQRGVAK